MECTLPGCRPNFTWQMLAALRQGRHVKLFTDEFRTPVDNMSAARGLLSALGRTRGVLHLGGRTRLSRYDFGLLLADRQTGKRANGHTG